MTLDDPLVVLIRIKCAVIDAQQQLAVAAQMAADELEKLGEGVKANFLRRVITQSTAAVAVANTEFADLLKRSEADAPPRVPV